MTTALEGGEWSAARPGRALPPGKNPVPIVQEAGWGPGPKLGFHKMWRIYLFEYEILASQEMFG